MRSYSWSSSHHGDDLDVDSVHSFSGFTGLFLPTIHIFVLLSDLVSFMNGNAHEMFPQTELSCCNKKDTVNRVCFSHEIHVDPRKDCGVVTCAAPLLRQILNFAHCHEFFQVRSLQTTRSGVRKSCNGAERIRSTRRSCQGKSAVRSRPNRAKAIDLSRASSKVHCGLWMN